MVKTRIDTMKSFSTYSMQYKRLKRYWSLIQLDFEKLDARDFKPWIHFKEMKTQYGLVMEFISVNGELVVLQKGLLTLRLKKPSDM